MDVSKRKPVSSFLEHQVRLPSSNQPDLQSYLMYVYVHNTKLTL